MGIYVILMLLTILATLALVIVLIIYLNKINWILASIGGTGYSFLAKLRVGLRAIETETAHLETEIVNLNKRLNETSEGFKSLEGNLKDTINQIEQQEKR